jgi:hypothetical protein
MTTRSPNPALQLFGPIDVFDLGNLPVLLEAEPPRDVRELDAYDAGYTQAVRDQLASLVLLAETFLRDEALKPVREPAANPARRTVYAFVDHLERQLGRMSPDSGFTERRTNEVEGGLGI